MGLKEPTQRSSPQPPPIVTASQNSTNPPRTTRKNLWKTLKNPKVPSKTVGVNPAAKPPKIPGNPKRTNHLGIQSQTQRWVLRSPSLCPRNIGPSLSSPMGLDQGSASDCWFPIMRTTWPKSARRVSWSYRWKRVRAQAPCRTHIMWRRNCWRTNLRCAWQNSG